MLTRRDADGSDAGTEGLAIHQAQHLVANARDGDPAGRPSLQANGFERVSAKMTNPSLDFLDVRPVVRDYYPECAELVKSQTEATEVFAFDHNVRSVAGKTKGRQIEGGQQVQAPARIVHGDYTLTSAPQRLRDLARAPSENDTYRAALGAGETLLDPDRVEQVLSGGRFAIINVWRNIVAEPVQRDPLAFCDAQSVRPEELVVFEIHYADRIGENYFAKSAEAHRWFVYPELTRDEAVLIKQWDSAGRLSQTGGAQGDASAPADAPCTFSFHSAFYDPEMPEEAPARWSAEVRCIAFFD
ncbi:MAG: CmcJ/NvfI family oxidoreductase [Myxococcota bacterium]